METDSPRPLSLIEGGVLDAMLEADFPGAAGLRQQAMNLLATPGCGCGCGTIDLHPAASASRVAGVAPIPVSATFAEPQGRLGGVIVFVTDGLLASLEVYAYDDPPAIQMPDPGWLEVAATPDG